MEEAPTARSPLMPEPGVTNTEKENEKRNARGRAA